MIGGLGFVYEARDAAAIRGLLTEDAARSLVSHYDPSLRVVALHAGRLGPNAGGPSFLGYVLEVSDDGGSAASRRIVLIDAERRELRAAPGVAP